MNNGGWDRVFGSVSVWILTFAEGNVIVLIFALWQTKASQRYKSKGKANSWPCCWRRRRINPSLGKNFAAVELGRLGGLKGGKARAEKLTAKKRSEIAKKAAKIDGAGNNQKNLTVLLCDSPDAGFLRVKLRFIPKMKYFVFLFNCIYFFCRKSREIFWCRNWCDLNISTNIMRLRFRFHNTKWS